MATIFYFHNLQANTFQCVLVSDGQLSFAIFLYADGLIQWAESENEVGRFAATVGVNTGVTGRYLRVPQSGTPSIIEIDTTSNVGRPGVWLFRLDGGRDCDRNSMFYLPSAQLASTPNCCPCNTLTIQLVCVR